MEEFRYKRINKNDENQVRYLVDVVFKNLERNDFLIPWTEEQMNRFFDEDYSFLYGAYDNNKLVGMCQIFTEKDIEEEYYDILNIDKSKRISELGGFLVLPEYRNKGIMTELSKRSYDLAKKLDFDYIISTVHPENIVSNRIIQKLDFKLHSVLETQSGFLRNLYWKRLN